MVGTKTPVGASRAERRLASCLVPFATAPTGVFAPTLLIPTILIPAILIPAILIPILLAACYAPSYSGRSPEPGPGDDDSPSIDVGADDDGDDDAPIDVGDDDVDVGGDADSDGEADPEADADADADGDPAGEGEGEPGEGEEEPGVELTADELDLFEALNDARRENGLDPVVIDERLLCAARNHAEDVGGSGECGHIGSDGSWPWDRAQACGYPQDDWTVNEIAAGPGFTSGDEAVWGWSQSPGHWAAIVHTEATSVGVGVVDTCYIALFDCCVAGG